MSSLLKIELVVATVLFICWACGPRRLETPPAPPQPPEDRIEDPCQQYRDTLAECEENYRSDP